MSKFGHILKVKISTRAKGNFEVKLLYSSMNWEEAMLAFNQYVVTNGKKKAGVGGKLMDFGESRLAYIHYNSF